VTTRQIFPIIAGVSQSLVVVTGPVGRDLDRGLPGAVVWKTCLREVAFVRRDAFRADLLRSGDTVLEDTEAYRVLLEIVCGLRSPLVGETEVMGQFRAFVARVERLDHQWSPLKAFCRHLLPNAKAVRTHHLTGLGSRSYGVLAARHLRQFERIAILGAGHLTRQLVPALGSHRVAIYCRRPAAAADLRTRHHDVVMLDLARDPIDCGTGRSNALIVAAPMSAHEIQSWVARSGHDIGLVLDFRAEGGRDALTLPGTDVTPLARMLEELEVNRRFTDERAEAARREIARHAETYWNRHELRPLGWEDLCA
jgi:glutamyl-tRNA reductase